ncbi:MAG: RluA family pseudouridine synthase [Christensenellales bacterium]|jgi:23S rRNA pseudouridine1911/1915/1917 synthase
MNFTVDSNQAGERLDRFLAQITGETRARIQSLIADGCASVNGAPPQKNGQLLREGDIVQLNIPKPREYGAFPQNIPLEIIHEDASIIVINKPRGMVVHPAAGNPDGTLVNALLFHCRDLSGIGGQLRPGIVHRLDKMTTGLIVAAKNDEAHISLSDQLKERSAGRMYAALLLGSLKSEHVFVDAPIARHKSDRKKMAISPDGRPAQTDFYAMQSLRSSTLVKCRLHTGRTHQIRVHAASIGHPVMGDEVYGPRIKNDAQVMMLHAYSLSFIHPASGEPISFSAAPPEDFLSELKRFGWQGEPSW